MAHKHSVRDTGAHYIIDQYTRQIKNDSVNKTTIVQFDHNSERLTFEMPLYVDGHAMTLCDLIEIHYINISTDGNSQNHGTYEVNDIKAEGEKAVFTWLISQECTQLAGSLNFFIVFKCTENGVTVYRWGTEIYKNLPISAGMDNGEAIVTEYPDILAQWKAQIFGAQDASVLAVEAAKESALAAIESAGEAKKQSVLDSIPDEYEALSALADQNHRNKAGSIILDAEGESISLNDASEYPLQNLKVFGKSTQDGTPTQDAPVDIVSIENPVVMAVGKNLLNNVRYTTTQDGVTFTVNDDKTVEINGTAEQDIYFYLTDDTMLVPGTYRLSGTPIGGSTSTYYMYLYPDYHSDQNGNGYTFNVEKTTVFSARIYIAKGTVCNSIVFKPKIEIGAETTAYEPYNGGVINVSHILPGIPVSSGGNYTDENGQQWICDEVDLARGVYVQRIRTETFSGGNADYWWEYNSTGYEGYARTLSDMLSGLRWNGYCNRFPSHPAASTEPGLWFGADNNVLYLHSTKELFPTLDQFKEWLTANPMVVVYPLATPIETPLTDAEINAFRALHSNRPNTTILNDAGAHMAVSYVADTKTYIDNKIKELMEGVTE